MSDPQQVSTATTAAALTDDPPADGPATAAAASGTRAGSAKGGSSRILVVDDNPAIHDDFRKILTPAASGTQALAAFEDALFGDAPAPVDAQDYEIASAFQGKEGLDLVERAVAEGAPFAFAFVDVRMPPGWDGVETVKHLWHVAPQLPIVICTAYSDYSWEQINEELGADRRLMILPKPFNPAHVLELAMALVERAKRSGTGE